MTTNAIDLIQHQAKLAVARALADQRRGNSAGFRINSRAVNGYADLEYFLRQLADGQTLREEGGKAAAV